MKEHFEKNKRQILMTITHLNRFHLRAVRKDTKVSELSLDNIFAKIIIGLWVSLLEVEYELLNSKVGLKKEKDSLKDKYLKLVDRLFQEKYLNNSGKNINQRNLGHDSYQRYKTLNDIINNELGNFIEIRNKIAHGQWHVAFSDSGNVNNEITAHVWKLSKKDLLILKTLVINIPAILNILFQSKKTFERDFDKIINKVLLSKEDNEIRFGWLKNKTRKI